MSYLEQFHELKKKYPQAVERLFEDNFDRYRRAMVYGSFNKNQIIQRLEQLQNESQS